MKLSRAVDGIVAAVVSLCVREWIETRQRGAAKAGRKVSLCVREWIETPKEEEKGYNEESPSA